MGGSRCLVCAECGKIIDSGHRPVALFQAVFAHTRFSQCLSDSQFCHLNLFQWFNDLCDGICCLRTCCSVGCWWESPCGNSLILSPFPEKHQLQQEYIACGLPILPSKRPDAANVPPVSRQDVIRTSMRILTGSAGQDVVRDYTLLLMATPTEQVWLP